MKKLLLALVIMMISAVVVAEEHPVSRITGTNIDLQTFDHAFAGRIKDHVAWGAVDEATFTSEMIMRKYEQTIKTVFQKGEKGVGGVVSHSITQDDVIMTFNTTISLKGVDPKNQQIKLEVNGEPVVVSITSDGMNNDHFVNPTYSMNLRGEDVEFTLYGEACYGLSIHTVMMIVGAYLH